MRDEEPTAAGGVDPMAGAAADLAAAAVAGSGANDEVPTAAAAVDPIAGVTAAAAAADGGAAAGARAAHGGAAAVAAARGGAAAVAAASRPGSHWIPLGLHGDDAGVAAGEKVLILTWGSLTLPKAPAFDTRIVFTMLKASEGANGATVQATAYRVLVWSFAALARGVRPTHDHDGVPFTQDHHPARAALAGQPLTLLGGRPVHGRWHEMRGDWKFLRESLHLRQHYGCQGRMCHLCMASRTPGPDFMGDFSRGARHRERVTHRAFCVEQRESGNPTPLLQIPGFNFRRVFFDVMHTLDLGILQVAAPSALHELLSEGAFGPPRLALHDRLLAATATYHRWCDQTRPSAKVKQFTQAWVKLPHPQIGQVQSKAAATRALAYWLRDLMGPLASAPGASRASKVRWGFFYWTCRADELMRSAGRHLKAPPTPGVGAPHRAGAHLLLLAQPPGGGTGRAALESPPQAPCLDPYCIRQYGDQSSVSAMLH